MKINLTYYNNKTKVLSLISIICTILMVLSLLTGCTPASSDPIEGSQMCFDTLIKISIYDNTDMSLLDGCFEICEKYENMLSPSVEDSDISRINSSNGEPVSVNEETIKLIEDSSVYSELTGGRFDISVYSVYELWDFHSHDNPLPDEKLIADTLPMVNYEKIEIDENNNTITLPKGAKIELGGIAKGYIADRLTEYLEDAGVRSAIINLGGDMHILGEKSKGTPFYIGIVDPNDSGNVLMGVKADNVSIATSGTYERYIEADEKIYHHIINPQTGYPVDTDIKSVTVISEKSESADAICTCAILLGSQKAIELIESLENTEAIIIDNDSNILKTSNADYYM